MSSDDERKAKKRRKHSKKEKRSKGEEKDEGADNQSSNADKDTFSSEIPADENDGDVKVDGGGGGGGDGDDNDNKETKWGGDGDAPAKRKRKRKRKKKGGNAVGAEGQGVEGEGDNKQAKLGSMAHTVYVEGIPFDCTDDDVKQFFAHNGIDDILQMRLPKWQDSGRLRGYGHVVFDSTESRVKALNDLNGLNLGKRYVTIKEPNAPKPGTTASAMQPNATGSKPRDQPEGCRIVFVKNLPFGADEDAIQEVFRPCGKILDGGVRLARNYTTRESKGFGYVEFKNPEGAYSAVHRAAKPFGLVVQGRPVFVDYDEGSMKGSFRTGEGKLWNKEHSNKQTTPGRGGGRWGGGRGGRGGRGGPRW